MSAGPVSSVPGASVTSPVPQVITRSGTTWLAPSSPSTYALVVWLM
ncbi:MAG TPA: hypothetical protein VFB74_07685 [Kribbellaceae bacterium]|nr:hypothetical protein [Kribbellaceae bacterium]